MSRFISHHDMTPEQIADCSYDAQAIVNLCAAAARGLDESARPHPGDIAIALELALELMATIHDAVETRQIRDRARPWS
jgi:hypothetical protein